MALRPRRLSVTRIEEWVRDPYATYARFILGLEALARPDERVDARLRGTEHAGATVAYFADEKDWRVWIGDASTSAFLGRPATAADLGDDGAFHAAKDAFLAAAQTAGDQAYAAQKKSAPPATPPPPAQQLKLQTDALLDAIITKLETKP